MLSGWPCIIAISPYPETNESRKRRGVTTLPGNARKQLKLALCRCFVRIVDRDIEAVVRALDCACAHISSVTFARWKQPGNWDNNRGLSRATFRRVYERVGVFGKCSRSAVIRCLPSHLIDFRRPWWRIARWVAYLLLSIRSSRRFTLRWHDSHRFRTSAGSRFGISTFEKWKLAAISRSICWNVVRYEAIGGKLPVNSVLNHGWRIGVLKSVSHRDCYLWRELTLECPLQYAPNGFQGFK